MGFLKRLYIYGISFFIGLVITIFFLNKKNAKFNYFPNSRVLNELQNKVILISKNENIDTSFIKNKYLETANVDFSKSEIKNQENPIYFITNKNYKNIDYIKIKNYKSKKECEIVEIKFNL